MDSWDIPNWYWERLSELEGCAWRKELNLSCLGWSFIPGKVMKKVEKRHGVRRVETRSLGLTVVGYGGVPGNFSKGLWYLGQW